MLDELDDETMRDLQDQLDRDRVLSDADFIGYFNSICKAFAVYVERERIRQGLWKEYPAAAQVANIVVKGDRIKRSLELIDKAVDANVEHDPTAQVDNVLEECDDIINYAVFTRRTLTGRF